MTFVFHAKSKEFSDASGHSQSTRYVAHRDADWLDARSGESMPDVFLSYGGRNRSQAERIASVLERAQLVGIVGSEDPRGGTFDQIVQRALAEARYVVVLWSASSITSRWVKDEATEGARADVLIPVLIDAVNLPLRFRQFRPSPCPMRQAHMTAGD